MWGWGAKGRNIVWCSLENIYKPKEEGDLGIRRIDLFKKALLAKWLCRMRSPEVGLWKDVLESKYRSWRTLKLNTTGQNKYKFRWWNDLSKASLSDQGSRWFDSNVVWQVGDDSKFKF